MLLQDGRVAEKGTYEDLMSNQAALHALMKEYGKRQQQEEEEAEEIIDEEFAPGSVGTMKSNVSGGSTPKRRRSSGAKLERMFEPSKTVAAGGTALILKEESAKGSVDWGVYVAYAKSCTLTRVAMFLAIAIINQCLSVGQNLYLANWADENDNANSKGLKILDDDRRRVLERLAVYGGLGLLFSFTVVGQTIFVWVLCGIRSARVMHEKLLNNVVRWVGLTLFWWEGMKSL